MKNIPLDLPHKQSTVTLVERSFSDMVVAETTVSGREEERERTVAGRGKGPREVCIHELKESVERERLGVQREGGKTE